MWIYWGRDLLFCCDRGAPGNPARESTIADSFVLFSDSVDGLASTALLKPVFEVQAGR